MSLPGKSTRLTLLFYCSPSLFDLPGPPSIVSLIVVRIVARVVVVVGSPAAAIVAKSPEREVNMASRDSRAACTLGERLEFARRAFNSSILESVSVFTFVADSLISSSGVGVVILLDVEATVVSVGSWFREAAVEEMIGVVLVEQ